MTKKGAIQRANELAKTMFGFASFNVVRFGWGFEVVSDEYLQKHQMTVYYTKEVNHNKRNKKK